MMLPAPGFIRRKALVATQNECALGPQRACSLTTHSLVQPEVSREYASFAQPLVPTHREQCLTGSICRGVNGLRGAVRQEAAFHISPQMIHRIQLWSRPWEAAHLNAQRFGTLPTGGRRVRGATIFEQDDVPSRPVPTNHRQKSLMRLLIPRLRNQEQHPATPDIEDPMKDTTRMLASHRHLDLLPTMPIAGDEGWGFGNDRLVQHQQNRVVTRSQTPFEPPFAWRHVAGRRAKRWRGRFHRRAKRARARLTLGRETGSACSSRRYWVSKGAVHTVEW